LGFISDKGFHLMTVFISVIVTLLMIWDSSISIIQKYFCSILIVCLIIFFIIIIYIDYSNQILKDRFLKLLEKYENTQYLTKTEVSENFQAINTKNKSERYLKLNQQKNKINYTRSLKKNKTKNFNYDRYRLL